jgi:ABC-type sulfate transport system permease subunit
MNLLRTLLKWPVSVENVLAGLKMVVIFVAEVADCNLAERAGRS